MCQCLRSLYPDPLTFLQKAEVVISAWLESDHSIDFSERVHSQMRRDLGSAGGAPNFVNAADRVLIRQFVADHVSKGGRDPASVSIFALQGADGTSASTRKRSKRVGLGCNPYFVFRNMRLHTKKFSLATDRPLSASELAQAESEIEAEWMIEAEDPHKYAMWEALFQARYRAAPLPAPVHPDGAHDAVVAASSAASKAFDGLWSLSKDPNQLVPVEVLHAHSQSKPHVQALEKVVVGGTPIPDRKSQITAGTFSLHGCHATVRNVCLLHGICKERAKSIEALAWRITHWVDNLSGEKRDGASELLCFAGHEADEEHPCCLIMCLLTLVFLSPKCQIFANCGLRAEDGRMSGRVIAPPPAFPYTVGILHEAPRLSRPGLGGDLRAISFATNLELAKFLVGTAPSWVMSHCTYTMVANETLLHMEVSSAEVVEPPATKVRVKKAAPVIPDVFDLGDPWAYGQSMHSEQPSAFSGDMCDSEDSLGDEVDEAPAHDFVDDVVEDASEVAAVVAMAPLAVEHIAVAEAAQGTEAAAGEAAEAVDAEAVARAVTPMEEALDSCEVGELMGYVKCNSFPWSEKRPLGRITFFPREYSRDRQSMAIKCYMHSNCSVTRGATRFTERQILRWLLDSHPLLPDEATPAARRAGGEAHMRRANVLLPKVAAS